MNVNKDAIRKVFELEKTAVDQINLVERISENLTTRPLPLPMHWPTFAFTIDTPSPTSNSASDWHTTLNDAMKQYDQIWLELSIPASDNSVSARLKRPFHQLVIFYVNKLGQKQIKFNDRLLRIINRLIGAEQEKDRKIQELEKQVNHLQKRLEALEQKQR